MSQSNIFFDIGNSSVKWRISDSKVCSEGIESFLLNKLPEVDIAWVSAVAHPHIVDYLNTQFSKVNLVQSQKKFEKLTISYKDSSSLGSDRFCAMLGAMKQCSEKPLLVIDVGTAMTFDVVDSEGFHQGGLIMPGLGALRKSFTKFETNDLSTHNSSLASDTSNAWKGGTQAMLLSTINDQINKFKVNFSDGVVTICGGIVNEIKDHLPESIQIFDNLVLDGLESYSQTVG